MFPHTLNSLSMKRSKSLYCVYISYSKPLLSRSWSVQLYVYAFNSCHALNRSIAHLHETLGIPLECIDHSTAQVINLPNFLK